MKINRYIVEKRTIVRLILPLIAAMALAMPVSAQDIIISGKVAGQMRTHVSLVNVAGDTIARADAQRGRFLLVASTAADKYTLCMSPAWSRQLLLIPGDTIKISGYLDRGGVKESDLKITRMEATDNLDKAQEEVYRAMQAFQDSAFKVTDGMAEPQRTNRLNEIIAADDSMRAEVLIGLSRRVGDPLVAATLCADNAPLQYENIIRLWNSLPDEAKATAPAARLRAIVDREKLIANGAQAPDITLYDRNGKAVQLSSLKGKPVVVDFWASWCGPCRNEMQYLKALYKELGSGKRVTFVSISLDDDSLKWRRADTEEQIQWNSWHDRGGFNASVSRKAYGFNQIPFLVLIDSNGKIVGKNLRRGRLKNAIINLEKSIK